MYFFFNTPLLNVQLKITLYIIILYSYNILYYYGRQAKIIQFFNIENINKYNRHVIYLNLYLLKLTFKILLCFYVNKSTCTLLLSDTIKIKYLKL